jgi:hypothetical protein
MKLFVYSVDPQGRRWLAPAHQRMRAVLRRLAGVVQRVELRLDDANGPLPGVDKRCRVEARLPGGTALQASATSRHWRDAVELALSQLRRHLLDALRNAAAAPEAAPGRLQLAPAPGARGRAAGTRTRPGARGWR